jgi:threonine 3-dehydrogenase
MGDSVVIIGAGPIGLFAIAFAKIMGAGQVIVLDVNAKRLECAREVGADAVLKPESNDIIQQIASLTKDFGGAGIVIEASGNVNAIHQAIQYARVGGKLFLIGQTNLPVSFHPSRDIVKKELTMRGFYGREIWQSWETAEELLLSGKLDVTPIISHKFSLDQFEEAFQTALSGSGAKILFVNA